MPPESIRPTSSTSDTLEIREARTDQAYRELLLLIDHATITEGDCIGFLPYGAYHEATESNRLFSLFRNGDRVGFLLWCANTLRELRILQIWVRRDARLIEHGRALIDHLEQKHARRLHMWQLRAWVADDLAANFFWPQIGFIYRGWRWGPALKSRRHRLWTRALTTTWTPNTTEVSRPTPVELSPDIQLPFQPPT